MGPVTHQTIRLSRGKHTSKDQGACVMELASMLSGETFTDHPETVCPVIGALLRAYNDAIDDRRRQDLYDYAAKTVGSRGSTELERVRAEQLISWISKPAPTTPAGRLFRRSRQALAARPPYDALAAKAVRATATRDGRGHRQMLSYVDRLLAVGASASVLPAGITPGAEPASAGCPPPLEYHDRIRSPR